MKKISILSLQIYVTYEIFFNEMKYRTSIVNAGKIGFS